ncbi:Crp/Fnr family transcriptional regulator [Glycomyces arizonensis]|uniref:Crp/Fnr family transcriptional regulator n=1 Tax=Glycomyces arizonensis TaxID=256035 RepID=UPI00047B1F3A|nr:Crp/Fnr family transcriptional regulator [Glycomyces arizonensis]
MEVSTGAWGDLLTDAEFAELAAQGHMVTYPARTVVIRQGDQSDFVLYLAKGNMKAVLPSARAVVEIHRAGDLVGELSSLTASPRSADVVTMTDVEALLVPGRVWREFITSNVRAACAHYSRLAERLLKSDNAKGLSLTSSESRLARAILRLAASGLGVETDDGLVISGFKQRDLAEIAKVSRESTVAVLGRLRDMGAVSTGRERLTVRNMDVIAQLAERDGTTGRERAG